MNFTDSESLREILVHLFPSIRLHGVSSTPSSQRIVYTCSFTPDESDSDINERSNWGEVVLKLSQDVHPSVIARLEKEIEILNSLNSPYYPTLYYYDVLSEDPVTEERFKNRLFVTIEEKIDGDTLNNVRDEFDNEAKVAKLLHELVNALEILWLHPQKIIHRDLKPDNILIKRDLSPVIIDLGIIREEGSVGLTHTHAVYGPCSPAYASPEQARNDKLGINFRSDLFALGIICYELIAKHNPFWTDENDTREDV